ncbi:hypothetical protein VZT92_012902 [Zoarces viviparus]|uniref:Uncharacterized protein n=1 Tax=Zoarces viviparus TaxID=48416 RepID=A0AAW1F1N0_ZOAVI
MHGLQQGPEQPVDCRWHRSTSKPPSVRSNPVYSTWALIDTPCQRLCPGSVYAFALLPTAQPGDCLQPRKAME